MYKAIVAVTEKEWYTENRDALTWYKETYPFLKDYTLPIPTNILLDFYIDDWTSRNFIPQESIKQDYGLLFSYFLENFPRLKDPTRFRGKTWFEYFINAVPVGISQTITDVKETVSDVFSLKNILIVAGLLILVLVIIVKLK